MSQRSKVAFAVVFTTAIWIWDRYGNFKDLLKSVGIDGFQLFLIALLFVCSYKAYEFHKAPWHIRLLSLLPVFIVSFPLLDWIAISNFNLSFLIVFMVAGFEFLPERHKSQGKPSNIEN